jgi:hypothetical protein
LTHRLANQCEKSTGDIDADIGVRSLGIEYATKLGPAVGLQHQHGLVSRARACDVQLPVEVLIGVQAREKNGLLGWS